MTGQTVGNIPEGVIREVIKYVRYSRDKWHLDNLYKIESFEYYYY